MNFNMASNFLGKASEKEAQYLLFGSVSAILYIVSAFFIQYYHGNNLFFQAVYLLSVSVFPAILWLAYKKLLHAKDRSLNLAGEMIFIINIIALFAFSWGVFFGLSTESVCCILSVYCGVTFFGLLFKFYKSRLFYHARSLNIMPISVSVLVIFSLAGSFFYGFFSIFSRDITALVSGLVYLKLYGRLSIFLLIAALSAVFFGWTFFSKKSGKIKTSKSVTLLICFSPVLLFDVMNNFDIEHYNAYLAPAVAVLNGKIPLVDVFCHYGLCYLIFTLSYLFLPNNYAVAAAVVSVLNVVCWVFFLLMLRNMIKNPLYFSVLAITSLFGINYLFGHTIDMLPSALCMRYLPTILLSYFLLIRVECASSTDENHTLFKLPIFNILLFLNIFWSFETLVALWIIFAAYLWVIPYAWKRFYKNIQYLFLWTFYAYGILAVVYWAFFGALLDYGIYLDYIYAYMNPYAKIGDRFLLPEVSVFRDSFFWIFLAVLHLVLFFYFLIHRLYKAEEDTYLKKVLFLNVVCIVFMAYFVLQATFVAMMASGYPSLILLFSVLVLGKEKASYIAFKRSAGIMLFTITFVFFISIVKSLFIEYQDFYKNGDILYTAFHKREFTLDRFLYNLTHFCSNKQISPGAGKVISVEENTCKRNAHHAELLEIIKKWYPDKKEILLFHRDLVEILVETKKVHKILVNPMNDSLLEGLYYKILGSAYTNVHEGDIIVVEKDLNVFPIEAKILNRLSHRFGFHLLDETPHLRVFRLDNKETRKSGDIAFSLNYKQIKASINYASLFEGKQAKVGVRALVDKDKETAWFVREDVLRKKDVFWIWIDLGKLFLINDIKIWRKIDFRKPDYAASENFKFLNDFNIEISEDNNKWSMESSEENFYIGSKYYYESKINDKKARYIRINVFSRELKEFSVSEIEVFGKRVM